MVAVRYQVDHQRALFLPRPPIVARLLISNPVNVVRKTDTSRRWCIAVEKVKDDVGCELRRRLLTAHEQ